MADRIPILPATHRRVHTDYATESGELRPVLSDSDEGEGEDVIGAVADLRGGGVRSECVNVVYEDDHGKYIWERGCLVRCELPLKLPIYYPVNNPSDSVRIFKCVIEAVVAEFKDPKATYMVEATSKGSSELPQPVIIHGVDLDLDTDLSSVKLFGKSGQGSDAKSLPCSHFCLEREKGSPKYSAEHADRIQVFYLTVQRSLNIRLHLLRNIFQLWNKLGYWL